MSKNTKDERYISKLVGRMSAATRALAESYLEQRRNEGLATRSVYTYALAISEVDRRLRGRPVASTNAGDLRAFVSTGQDHKHTSRFQTSIFTRASLKWALRVKTYRRTSTRRPTSGCRRMRLTGILRQPLVARVLHAVCESPGGSQAAIARRVPNRTRQDVAHHIQRLYDPGVVQSERDSATVRYRTP